MVEIGESQRNRTATVEARWCRWGPESESSGRRFLQLIRMAQLPCCRLEQHLYSMQYRWRNCTVRVTPSEPHLVRSVLLTPDRIRHRLYQLCKRRCHRDMR